MTLALNLLILCALIICAPMAAAMLLLAAAGLVTWWQDRGQAQRTLEDLLRDQDRRAGMNRADIYAAIDDERQRQADKWGRPHDWGMGDCSSAAVHDSTKVMVLTEECGEVARAVLDLDIDATRTELIQVAAVAVAWLESM